VVKDLTRTGSRSNDRYIKPEYLYLLNKWLFKCLTRSLLVQRRFCTDSFDRDYKATIGVDFEVEKFSVLSVPMTVQL